MPTLKYSDKDAIAFLRKLEDTVLERVQTLPVIANGTLTTHPKLKAAKDLGTELGLAEDLLDQAAAVLGPIALRTANKIIAASTDAIRTKESRAALTATVRGIFRKNELAIAPKKVLDAKPPVVNVFGSPKIVFGSLDDVVQNTTRKLNNIDADYRSSLHKSLRSMENDIMTKVYNLPPYGQSVADVDEALAQSIKVHAELNSIYKENFGASNRRQVQRGYRVAMQSVEEQFEGLGIPLAWGKADTKLVEQLFGNTLQSLDGLSSEYLEKVSEAIRSGIVTGKKETAIMDEVRGLLTGGKDAAGRSLSSHARVLVHDSIMSTQRQLSIRKAKSVGIKFYMWAGSVIASSRPMCASNAGRILTEFDLNELDLYTWKGKSGPIWSSLGGFHCRHHLVPLSDLMAKKIKSEFGPVFPSQNYYAKKGANVPPSGKTRVSPSTYKADLKKLRKLFNEVMEIPGVREGVESYAIYYGKGLWNKIDFLKIKRNRRKKGWRKDVGKFAYDKISPLVPQDVWIKAFDVSDAVTPYVNRAVAVAESALTFAQREVDSFSFMLDDLRDIVTNYHPLVGDKYPKARDAWTHIKSNRAFLSKVRAVLRDLQKENATLRKKINKGLSTSTKTSEILEAIKGHYPDLGDYTDIVKTYKPVLDSFLKTTRKMSLAASKRLTASDKALSGLYKSWTKVIKTVNLPYQPLDFFESQVRKVERALSTAQRNVSGFKKDVNSTREYLRKMAYPMDDAMKDSSHQQLDLWLDTVANEYSYNMTKQAADEVFEGLDEAFMKMKRVVVKEVQTKTDDVQKLLAGGRRVSEDLAQAEIKTTKANVEALGVAQRAAGNAMPQDVIDDLASWGIRVKDFNEVSARIAQPSTIGVRLKSTSRRMEELLDGQGFKNIYQSEPDSLFAAKGIHRDKWEDNLSDGAYTKSKEYKAVKDKGALPSDLAEERPFYGFMFNKGKTRSASGYGEIIAEFNEGVSDFASLSPVDSSSLAQSAKTKWGQLGTFAEPTPVASRLHTYLKSHSGDKSELFKALAKGDPQESLNKLVGNGYIEAQIHTKGALSLDNVKKLWLDKSSIEHFTLSSKEYKASLKSAEKSIKKLSKESGIPWGYLDDTARAADDVPDNIVNKVKKKFNITCASPCSIDIETSSPAEVASALRAEKHEWLSNFGGRFIGVLDTSDIRVHAKFGSLLDMGYSVEVRDSVAEAVTSFVKGTADEITSYFDALFAGDLLDEVDEAFRSYLSILDANLRQKLPTKEVPGASSDVRWLDSDKSVGSLRLGSSQQLDKLNGQGVYAIAHNTEIDEILVYDFKAGLGSLDNHPQWARTPVKERSESLKDLSHKMAIIANLNEVELTPEEIRTLSNFTKTKYISQKATRSPTQAYAEATIALDKGYNYVVDPDIIKIIDRVENKLEIEVRDVKAVSDEVTAFVHPDIGAILDEPLEIKPIPKKTRKKIKLEPPEEDVPAVSEIVIDKVPLHEKKFYMGFSDPKIDKPSDLPDGHRGYFFTDDPKVAYKFTGGGAGKIKEARIPSELRIFDHTDPEAVEDLVDYVATKYDNVKVGMLRDSLRRGNFVTFEQTRIKYALEDLNYVGNTQTEEGGDLVVRLFKKSDIKFTDTRPDKYIVTRKKVTDPTDYHPAADGGYFVFDSLEDANDMALMRDYIAEIKLNHASYILDYENPADVKKVIDAVDSKLPGYLAKLESGLSAGDAGTWADSRVRDALQSLGADGHTFVHKALRNDEIYEHKVTLVNYDGLIDEVIDPAVIEPDQYVDKMVVNDTTKSKIFKMVADAQRGDPETRMVEAQRALGGSVYDFVIEHVGDLTHRMTTLGFYNDMQPAIVLDKVEKTLNMLKSGYGFEKELKEQLKSNGVSTKVLREVGQKYADAHKLVPVYNDLQFAAREAAVAMGELRYDDAIKHLEKLQASFIDDTYVQKAKKLFMDYEPRPDIPKVPIERSNNNWSVVDDITQSAEEAGGLNWIPEYMFDHLGDHVAELSEEILDVARHISNNISVGIRVPLGAAIGDPFEFLIDNPALKNQFQLRDYATSKGSLAPAKGGSRDDWERTLSDEVYQSHKDYNGTAVGDFLTESAADERPTYGFLFGGGNSRQARAYGNVVFEMDDEILFASTFTEDNSSMYDGSTRYGMIGTFDNLTPVVRRIIAELGRSENLKKWLSKAKTRPVQDVLNDISWSYIEAQVHTDGPVSLTRAKKLWIDTDHIGEDTITLDIVTQQVKELSELYRIPWGFMDDGVTHYPKSTDKK